MENTVLNQGGSGRSEFQGRIIDKGAAFIHFSFKHTSAAVIYFYSSFKIYQIFLLLWHS